MTNGSSTFSLMLLYTVILQIPTYSILYIHSECVWKLQNLQCITEVLSLSPPAPWDRVIYKPCSLCVCMDKKGICCSIQGGCTHPESRMCTLTTFWEIFPCNVLWMCFAIGTSRVSWMVSSYTWYWMDTTGAGPAILHRNVSPVSSFAITWGKMARRLQRLSSTLL